MRVDSAAQSINWVLGGILLFTFLLRVSTIGSYPLMDTTEARYGEMARLMVESDHWLAPQFSEGVPYWGKPPLSFWAAAGSAKLLGVSEFSLRLPSAIFFGLTLSLMGIMIAPYRRRLGGFVAAVVASTSLLGFLALGAIWTDVSLLFSIALIQVGFWKAVVENCQVWSFAPFFGAALAMLSKGPVGLVIPGIAIFAWCFWAGRWGDTFRRLPWFRGVGLILALTVPWYWAAEQAAPGFLNYFLVGEHLSRFLTPDWAGDLYGTAHPEPRGTIWWFAWASFFPWSVWMIGVLVFRWSLVRATFREHREFMGYILCCLLVPVLLFTFARNIIAPYVLPALPAFSILNALLIVRSLKDSSVETVDPNSLLPILAAVIPAFYTGALIAFSTGHLQLKSQKPLVLMAAAAHARLCYLEKIPFSGNFYSHGTAVTGSDCRSSDWVAGRHSDVNRFLDDKQFSTSEGYRRVYEDRRYIMLAPIQLP